MHCIIMMITAGPPPLPWPPEPVRQEVQVIQRGPPPTGGGQGHSLTRVPAQQPVLCRPGQQTAHIGIKLSIYLCE
jgi:hypothetical protein